MTPKSGIAQSSAAAVLLAVCWVTSAAAQTQNCAINSGTDVDAVVQNCAAPPRLVAVKPTVGERIAPIDGPNDLALYRQYARIGGPIDVRVVACGEGVLGVVGEPMPPSPITASALKDLSPNCVGAQYSQVRGAWIFQATAKSKGKPVTIRVEAGNFPQTP